MWQSKGRPIKDHALLRTGDQPTKSQLSQFFKKHRVSIFVSQFRSDADIFITIPFDIPKHAEVDIKLP